MIRRTTRVMRGEEGFTLLETLVALAILGISLGIAVQSIALASGRIVMTEQAHGIEMLAKRLVAGQSASAEPALSEGKDSGTGYRWAMSSEPVAMGEGVIASVITVTVTADGMRRQRFTFRTVRTAGAS